MTWGEYFSGIMSSKQRLKTRDSTAKLRVGPVFVTKEIDPVAFQAGIWMSKATMLSPFVIEPENINQTLEDTFNEQKRIIPIWVQYAVIGGIGQYSLKNEPSGILGKLAIHFRHPTESEMKKDFSNFGDQVTGPAVGEAGSEENSYKSNAVFELWGKNHYFVGPERIVKAIFSTRVFPGELPEKIKKYAEEVSSDGESEKHLDNGPEGYTVVPQPGLQFFHADKGVISYRSLKDVEDYNPNKLLRWGVVVREQASSPDTRNKLLFLPKGLHEDAKDFSIVIRED